jgi:branched-chain amino acid aminotransferase
MAAEPGPVPRTSVELASLDGEVRPAADTFVPATDEGLLRGDGVFEVIRVYGGRPFALAEHLERLERSAQNLRLSGAERRDQLADEAARLLEERGGPAFDGVLRVVITRGGRRLLLTEPLKALPERIRLALVTYAPTRVLDGIKSLSYAGNMLASRLARERGFDEALLTTPHGRVLEAPTSTLFWVRDGRLYTPPLDEHILASITRRKLIELLDVEERPCPTDELLEAHEAFLASTIREVHSIAGIEERSFPETGEVTRKAAAVLRAAIEAELG